MTFIEAIEANRKQMPFNRITIDGNEINGYFIYTFFEDKTYVESPYRSTSGVIDNLNSYVTFRTPRLRISFKFMKLHTYQTIMRLIQMKNEFVVECYDPVWDRTIKRKMYFHPQDFPEIFHHSLEILGMVNYTIELVGTNADLGLLSIVYHKNDDSGTTLAGADFHAGQEVLIGRGISFTPPAGSVLGNWNTKPDGTGFTFVNNQAYTPVDSLVLYAQWHKENVYNLTFNYGHGITKVENGQPLYTRRIAYNEAYGTLPTTQPPAIEFNNVSYSNAFTFEGWFKTPTIGTGSVAIKPTDKYSVQADSQIFQIYTPNTYTITFDSVGGTAVSPIRQQVGSRIYAPNPPTRANWSFGGWYLYDGATQVEFTFYSMPPTNVTLYAKWTAT